MNRKDRRASGKVAPSGVNETFERAAQCFNAGQFHEAQRICQKLVGAKTANPDVHNLLGAIFKKTGDLKRAIESFGKAIALNRRIQVITTISVLH